MTRVMAAHACTGAELGETEAPLEPPICLRDEAVIEVHVVRDKDAVPYELHEAGDEGSRRAAARETGECLPPPAREYVADCTCRGNPWDEAALARHRAYAEAAQADKEKAVATVEEPRSDQQGKRERGGRSQRWARSGGRERAGNED